MRSFSLTSEIVLTSLLYMTTKELLLTEIEAFLTWHDMAPTEFGELSCKDRHVVRRLRDGFGLTVDRLDEIREFMATFSPKPRRKRRQKNRSGNVSAAA